MFQKKNITKQNVLYGLFTQRYLFLRDRNTTALSVKALLSRNGLSQRPLPLTFRNSKCSTFPFILVKHWSIFRKPDYFWWRKSSQTFYWPELLAFSWNYQKLSKYWILIQEDGKQVIASLVLKTQVITSLVQSSQSVFQQNSTSKTPERIPTF